MTTPSERLKQAVDNVFTAKPAPDKLSWADRIGDWLLGVIARSAKRFLEDEEPSALDNVKDTLIRIRDNPNTPPEIKSMTERALEPRSAWQAIVFVIFGIVMLIQTIGTIAPPSLK